MNRTTQDLEITFNNVLNDLKYLLESDYEDTQVTLTETEPISPFYRDFILNKKISFQRHDTQIEITVWLLTDTWTIILTNNHGEPIAAHTIPECSEQTMVSLIIDMINFNI